MKPTTVAVADRAGIFTTGDLGGAQRSGGLDSCADEVVARCGGKLQSISLRDEFSHFVGGHRYQRERAGLSRAPDLGGG